MRCAAALTALVALIVFALPARAQDESEQIRQLRIQCRIELGLPAHERPTDETLRDKVGACMRTKAQAAGTALPGQRPPESPVASVALIEATPFLVHAPLGPGAAKGVVYFVSGYPPGHGIMVDAFEAVPYFLKTLADQGWDVIVAKVPQAEEAAARGAAMVDAGAAAIAQRVAALHAQGYRRIVAGGHSWGGWATLLAERDDGLAADALLISSPNAQGPRISPATGGPNPSFARSGSEFPALVAAVRVPTAFLFMGSDPFEIGGRGAMANQARAPHVVIDQPPGFTGHYAGWLPVFDFGYGDCIRRLLTTGAAGACAPPPLSNSDFRSIASLSQIGDPGARRIASPAPLAGHVFFAYTLQDRDNKQMTYDASGATRTTLVSAGANREAVAFQNGQQCAGQTCTILVQWAPGQILEFDPAGPLRAWWIEVR
jgi:dienelactone hydrolase